MFRGLLRLLTIIKNTEIIEEIASENAYQGEHLIKAYIDYFD